MMIRKQVYQWELTPANSFGNQSDGSWQATINTFGGGGLLRPISVGFSPLRESNFPYLPVDMATM